MFWVLQYNKERVVGEERQEEANLKSLFDNGIIGGIEEKSFHFKSIFVNPIRRMIITQSNTVPAARSQLFPRS